MKKKEVIYLVSVLMFSFLFYRQQAGINFFLFSVAVTLGWAFIKPSLLRDRLWIFLGISSVLGGFAVWLYGNALSLWACILSLSLLSAVSFSEGSTLLLALVYSAFSYASSPVRMVINTVNYRSKRENTGQSGFFNRFGTALIIGLVVIIFFVLYQQSNTLFKQFTKSIDLSWINFSWLMFTVLGAVILFAYYYPANFPAWHSGDRAKPNQLSPEDEQLKPYTFLNRPINPKSEYSAGLILLILLNILLLLVNSVDVIYLYFKEGIPEGLSYSEFVHQGTGNLILSILIAILVIMFLFRGKQHFSNKLWLKSTALIWVVQNIILLSSAAYKNSLYIGEYALTYKRIGVYIYLILALIGLIYTGIKISKNMTNWYLLRRNSIAFMAVLVLASLINWDWMITRHNLMHSDKVDYKYLISLGHYPVPYLLQIDTLQPTLKDVRGENGQHTEIIREFHAELFGFIEAYQKRSWKSHCIMRAITYRKIRETLNTHPVSFLFVPDWSTLFNNPDMFKNSGGFDFSNGNYSGDSLPKQLAAAKYLNLNGNSFNSAKALANFRNLEFVNLSYNELEDVSGLSSLSKLNTLIIRGNRGILVDSLKNNTTLEELDLSENTIKSYAFMTSMNRLRKLSLEMMMDPDWKSLPALPALQILNITGNRFYSSEIIDESFAAHIPNLKELNAADCDLNSLLFFTNYASITDRFGKFDTLNLKSLFPELELINFENNKISSADALDYFPTLKVANLGHNKIKSAGKGALNNTLEKLSLNDNKLKNLDGIERFQNLRELNLSMNGLIDIKPLLKLKKLEKLDISFCSLSDISALASLTALKSITIDSEAEGILKSLSGLNQIEELHLFLNDKCNLSPLGGMTSLKTIYLYYATDLQFTQIREIFGTRLKVIRISDPTNGAELVKRED